MKTGRKLDRLIAEKVMGWKPNYPGGWPHPPNNISNRKRYLDKEGCSVIPSYSIDIAEAWEVVNKFKNIEMSSMLIGSPKYFCVELLKNKKWYKASAETFPAAICLAALKASQQK